MRIKSLMRCFVIAASLVVFVLSLSHAQTAKTINEVACNALEKENYYDKNGVIKLYGIRINGTDTNHGKWACAKVATILLKEAGVTDKISLGVRHVESELDHWEKIHVEENLKPGDVIVWLNRFTGRDDKKCTGGGNCHVGIVTDYGYFHNSSVTGTPTFGGMSLWAFRFKVGFRPPN